MYFVMDSIIKNWSAQIRKGYLDLSILTLIDVENKIYGFEIISKLKNLGIEIKEGTLYPLLSKMTNQELLKTKWETEDIKGHPRKFYSLTPKGKQVLLAMENKYNEMATKLEKIKKSKIKKED